MSADGLTIWVASSTSGLFKSIDGGSSWTVIVTRAVGKLACSRDGSKIAYFSNSAPFGLFTTGF
jgi:hypothetical protein